MKKTIAICILLILPISTFAATQEYYTTKLSDLWIITKQNNISNYNLKQNVLRQEIAWVTRWLAGLEKKATCTWIFNDVSATSPNDWACSSIEALADSWLIAKNKYFYPESNISKAESVWMVVKAVFWNEYSYDSNKSGTWEKQVVDFSVKKWILIEFTDYSTYASRWFVFEIAANAIDIEAWKVVDLTNSWTRPTWPAETLEEAIMQEDLDEDIEMILCELLNICK